MDARWLKYTPTEEHEQFKNRILSTSDVLETLDRLLEELEKAVEIARSPDYDTASWGYKQADLNGYIRAIREARKFLVLN